MGSIASHVAAAKSSGSSSFLIFIVFIIGAMYFLFMRPGRKRQQKVAQQQNAVQPGARVRTTAGMYATVVAVDGDDVILEIAPDVEARYMKRAIMEVIGDTGVAEDEAAGDVTDEDGLGDDDETAGYDEHLENQVHEENGATEHGATAVPAGAYGDDLTINGQPDKANGSHGTVTPGSTAAQE
ncbi:MAG TPA: preprotein translocase subunit YajC [Streptosporangiaceae bacterium]